MLNILFRSRGIKTPLFFLIFWIAIPSYTQSTMKIRAKITDALSGESLIGAHVFDIQSNSGSYTNEYGYFFIEIKSETILFIQHIGYESCKISVNEIYDNNFIIKLKPLENFIKEIEITDKRNNYELNKIYFTQKDISSTVILGGESDVLKSLTLTPGIKSGVEGTSNIFVRGGDGDQNLFLVEGVPVYNMTHLFGLVSIFPSDHIQSVSTYKGSFPAKYGGRLSSVFDIRLKSGNTENTEKSITLGILSSKANINGAFFNSKLRYNLTYRRNLFDFFNKLLESNQNGKSGIHFSDYNIKITYDIGKGNYVQFFNFLTNEIWQRSSRYFDGKNWNENVTKFKWGNSIYQWKMYGGFLDKGSYDINIYTYKYNSILNNKSHLGIHETDFKKDFFNNNLIKESTVRADFKYPIIRNMVFSVGSEVKFQTFVPGQTFLKQSIKDITILDTSTQINQYKTTDLMVYINNEYIRDKWILNTGLNLNINRVQQTPVVVEPRVMLAYNIVKNLDIHSSFAKTTQNIHLLSNNSLGLPIDTWIGSINDILFCP